MNERIEHYIDRVRTICAQPLSGRKALDLVRDAATELVSEPLVLDDRYQRLPEAGYGRNLIHRDPDHGFVVVAMIWPPDVGSLPHDHGTWGVTAVAQGTLRITNFDRDDDGSQPDRGKLTPRCTLDAGVGAVTTVLPPHDDYHEIHNPSQTELAISIHTYGKDVESCHVFDQKSGSCEIVHPRYTI